MLNGMIKYRSGFGRFNHQLGPLSLSKRPAITSRRASKDQSHAELGSASVLNGPASIAQALILPLRDKVTMCCVLLRATRTDNFIN